VRDNFSKQTIIEIAKGVGWRCSNPECARATVAANEAQDGTITIADASHICAASPGGPRYNAAQESEARKSKSNGIWLCKVCARLVDVDPAKYTVELLVEWKRVAQDRALREVLAPRHLAPTQEVARVEALIAAEVRSGATPGFAQVFTKLHAAASADLEANKRSAIWSTHPAELTLTLYDNEKVQPFHISELPLVVEVAPEVTIIAPPGTGKTTTLLQLAGHVLARNAIIPVFFRLGDWSAGSSSLLASLRERRAFQAVTKVDIELLAERGRLLLLLDGWNEIEATSQRKLRVELDQIRREFPDVRIIATTRRQMLDVPISGPRIEIEPLSEEQQIDIARKSYGEAGEKAVDHAWRESGVRDLITTPLYLNSLLAGAPNGVLPTTKEEVLRLFVERHERAADHAEALRSAPAGRHSEILTALAVKMTATGATTLSDAEARTTVSRRVDLLRKQGQIASPREPGLVLDVLTSHHTLIRAGGNDGAISFQHQQFQEWYASQEVSALMGASASGDAVARERLRVEIFDKPAWEEAILFAVERLSDDKDRASTVAAAVRLALPVDPMLAAEMIYRSSPAIWENLKADIVAFVERWHTPGRADRAVRFMTITGRPEFASLVWPLASSGNSQIQVPTLRIAPRFRPSVLGPDLQKKMAVLSEEPREHLLTLMAAESGVDGMDLATDLALADPSAKIQTEVVQYLQFRRADRHVARLLEGALAETWTLLAKRGYSEENRDLNVATRLRAERDKLIQQSTDPVEKIGLLIEQVPASVDSDEALAQAIADPAFPARDQRAGWALYDALQRAPSAVLRGLNLRLERGLELPFHATDLLKRLPVVDDGPVAALALDMSEDKNDANVASALVGPKTVGELLDKYLISVESLQTSRNDKGISENHHRLSRRIAATRVGPFIEALLPRADQSDPAHASALADLIAHHGDSEQRSASLNVDSALKSQIIGAVRTWVEVVSMSPNVKRHHLYPVANAIGRLGYPELLPELMRLLDEELARLKKARVEAGEMRRRGVSASSSDATMVYANQYQNAFVRIGGDRVPAIVTSYLDEPLFGVEAGLILKALSDNDNGFPESDVLRQGPRFEAVAVARSDRTGSRLNGKATASETAMFEAITRLGKAQNDRDSQLLAIKLGSIALAMPHTSRDAEIAALLNLPQPLSAKWDLFAAMAVDGQILDEKIVMQGVDDWLVEAQKDEPRAWHKRQNTWEIEPWLELLPFTGRPDSVIDGMTKVKAFYGSGHPQRFDRVLRAVANVPGPEGDELLRKFAKEHIDVADDYSWMRTILRRDSPSAALLCVDLVNDGLIGHGPYSWHLAQELSAYVTKYPELKAEFEKRYRASAVGPAGKLLEHLFSEIGDVDDIIEMVKVYAAASRPYDGNMNNALRGATVWHESVPGSQRSHYIRPASVAKLRRFLFGLTSGTPQEAALAKACLTGIDELRDEHGIAADDFRHPDVLTGKPWPLEAG
jgi:hypothetical protein